MDIMVRSQDFDAVQARLESAGFVTDARKSRIFDGGDVFTFTMDGEWPIDVIVIDELAFERYRKRARREKTGAGRHRLLLINWKDLKAGKLNRHTLQDLADVEKLDEFQRKRRR